MNEEPSVTADLARVLELDAKATQGPLFAHDWYVTDVSGNTIADFGWTVSDSDEWTAKQFVEYRTLTPRLARELAAARAAIKVARELIEKSPHTFMCASRNYVGGPINSHCDCGRTAALAQLNTHTHE